MERFNFLLSLINIPTNLFVCSLILYSIVKSLELTTNQSTPQIATGDNGIELQVTATVKDSNGLPLEFMPILFYSDNDNILFSDYQTSTNAQGYAVVTVTHPSPTANGYESANVYARLDYDIDETQAKLQQLNVSMAEEEGWQGGIGKNALTVFVKFGSSKII